jgi:aryl-alcohol dehydrogenase-like predicted oxidoreductase
MKSMRTRKIGKNGPEVSVIGLGCMGMSEFYGKTDDNESKKTIIAALQNGITMLDTADVYGVGHNEELIGSVLKEWKDDVFISTKFSVVKTKGSLTRTTCGRPDYVKSAAEGSLRRLQRDVIDLYLYHRLDTSVPVEETIGAMADLVKEGKVKHIGICEVSSETIRRAHAVHPLTAVESEYSLWTRYIEKDIMPTCKELGIGFIGFAPLGRGFLTGKVDSNVITQEGDIRKGLTRLQGENYDSNMALVRKLEEMAAEKGVKAAQLALAWVLAQENVHAIPGTKRIPYLMENIAVTEIVLTEKEIQSLSTLFAPEAVKGERYPMSRIGEQFKT